MPRLLKLYIAGLVISSAIALLIASLWFPIDPRVAIDIDGARGASRIDVLAGLGFWVAVALFASALPVRMPGGLLIAVSIAPVMAAANLGGPAAGAWVAFLGTTEFREIRGRVPRYGTLANHAAIVLP